MFHCAFKQLEEVKEKETYKRAKEILEKYDPESVSSMELPPGTPAKKFPDLDGQGELLCLL